MKIALIGDVHANLPALEAVIEDALSRGADIFINTGDYTGYGPFPDETVKTLSTLETVSVIGNYDRKVLKADRKLEEWKKHKRKEKWSNFKWTLEHLSEANRTYLSCLPREKLFRFQGKRVLLNHICPHSPSHYLGSDTAMEVLEEIASGIEADMILMGHSHSPFAAEAGSTWFINPGSVGRPDDGDPRASYAIIDLGGEKPLVNHYRVEYDVQATLNAIEEKGLPSIFAQMFEQGRNLDFVDPPEEDQPEMDPHENEDTQVYEEHTLVTVARNFTMETAPIHAPHCRQVAQLSLFIYDQLLPLHTLGREERLILELAAHLHDIGWVEGQKGHNKTSMKMIQSREDLIKDRRIRKMVANVARYHRKAFPDLKHKPFRELEPGDRHIVQDLSSILRIADGLDWDHTDNVKEIFCESNESTVRLICRSKGSSEAEMGRGLEKGVLFEKTFNRKLEIEWHRI